MRKLIKTSLASILIASLGGLGGYWIRGYNLSNVANTWYEINQIPLKGNDSGIAYETDALFNSDIPLPNIKSVKAKVKFLPRAGKIDYQLGYVITMDITDLDLKKIPEKYKIEKSQVSKSGEWTIEPIKKVSYEVSTAFELRDQDGFRLFSIQGSKHNVLSGQSNSLQETAEIAISKDIIERTKIIIPKVTIEKCLSCN